MVTLTVEEEAVYKKLVREGHPELASFMRERYVGEHELFDELKHVDVDTLYGPAVPDHMRGAMRRAIADGDRAVVSSLHSLCLTMEEQAKPTLTERSVEFLPVVAFAAVAGIIVGIVSSFF